MNYIDLIYFLNAGSPLISSRMSVAYGKIFHLVLLLFPCHHTCMIFRSTQLDIQKCLAGYCFKWFSKQNVGALLPITRVRVPAQTIFQFKQLFKQLKLKLFFNARREEFCIKNFQELCCSLLHNLYANSMYKINKLVPKVYIKWCK